MVTMRYGDKESSTKHVKSLQHKLNSAGFSVGAVDGIFGNMTLNAIKKFQSSEGLPATGIADEGFMLRLSLYNPSKAVVMTTATEVKSFDTPKFTVSRILNNKTLIYLAGALVIIAMIYPVLKRKRA